MSHPATRGTILTEDCHVLEVHQFEAEQFVMRLDAPRIAAGALPGSFIHLACTERLPMRRPLSIMRCSPEEGWLDVLFKVVGDGTRALAGQPVGAVLNALGPIGRGFEPDTGRALALLLGGGVGIPPMVFLAERMAAAGTLPGLVIMGSEVPFPFVCGEAGSPLPGIGAHVNGTMAELDALGVPNRLASRSGLAGCHDGFVTDLAREWLNALPASDREQVTLYACGPNPMLGACAALAAEFALPAWVSLEEFMACAVGGCAGCTVRVNTANGPAMKRVCVDGPVFAADQVDWNAIPG